MVRNKNCSSISIGVGGVFDRSGCAKFECALTRAQPLTFFTNCGGVQLSVFRECKPGCVTVCAEFEICEFLSENQNVNFACLKSLKPGRKFQTVPSAAFFFASSLLLIVNVSCALGLFDVAVS